MTAQCITAKSDCERRLKFNWADASVKLEAGSWKLEAGSQSGRTRLKACQAGCAEHEQKTATC